MKTQGIFLVAVTSFMIGASSIASASFLAMGQTGSAVFYAILAAGSVYGLYLSVSFQKDISEIEAIDTQIRLLQEMIRENEKEQVEIHKKLQSELDAIFKDLP